MQTELIDDFYSIVVTKCFGQTCGRLQGDLFENKNIIITKMCLSASTLLNNHVISG